MKHQISQNGVVSDSIRIEGIHEKNMKKAYNAGVKIVMGTDSGVVPHGRNLEELGYLVDIGMDPMEAIIAGTKTGSRKSRMGR